MANAVQKVIVEFMDAAMPRLETEGFISIAQPGVFVVSSAPGQNADIVGLFPLQAVRAIYHPDGIARVTTVGLIT